jgi:hypothetical protein
MMHGSIKMWSHWFRRNDAFKVNPLEPIDLEARVSRIYDQWVGAVMSFTVC